jgi:hypothetical protein
MNDAAPTLDNFFQYRQTCVDGSKELKALDSSNSLTRVREKAGNSVKKNPLPVTADQLRDPIGGLLDISLLDIIVRAWNEHKLFEKYLDPDKYDPKESVLISLKKHSISSSHSPHIDVSLNGQKLGQIDFQIDLALTLEGIILELRGGELREIRFGNMKGRGTLKCEDLVLLKRDTGTIEFPGKVRFSGSDLAPH